MTHHFDPVSAIQIQEHCLVLNTMSAFLTSSFVVCSNTEGLVKRIVVERSSDLVSRHLAGPTMRMEAQCSSCERSAGGPAGGAAINSIGCTGACVHWAVQLIGNPPCWEDEPFNWEAWALDPAALVSFQKICSNLNGFGCGYLFWDCVDAHISREEMTAEAWIALVVRRYQFF